MLIQHSAELQTWFEAMCKQDSQSSRMETRNLRAAKHRFESYSMPLNRVCRHFHAYVRVAIKAAHLRTDKAGQGCADFLQWVSTPKALLLGMLADAGDEALCLTRFFDCEAVDAAEANAEVDRFLSRVEALFGANPKCFEVAGFTRLMTTFLSTPLVWVLNGKQMSLGQANGPTLEQKEHCLDRMRCWLKLCRATLAAEFPDFELAKAAVRNKNAIAKQTVIWSCRQSRVSLKIPKSQTERPPFASLPERTLPEGVRCLLPQGGPGGH